MTITEFLEARITEDEAAAAAYERFANGIPVARKHKAGDDRPELRMPDPKRLLAECAAKRAIVHYCAGLGVDRYRDAEVDAQYRAAWWIAVQLAKVYKDHPDYRQEWAL